MDAKRQRPHGKYDRLTRLEGRIDSLEGVIYQLFQLTEKLLTTLEHLDHGETGQTSRHTKLLVVLGRNNPSLYTVKGRPLYVHLNGLAIVLLK